VTTFDFFFSQNTPQTVIPAIPRRIPARSSQNLTKIQQASFSFLFFFIIIIIIFFFYEQIWGPIREQHEAGVGGR
jgi:hypothetical protein